jgi:hypothetical protein
MWTWYKHKEHCFAVSTKYCYLCQGINMGLILLVLGHLYENCHINGDAIGGFKAKTLGCKVVCLLNDVIMICFGELFLN